MKKTNRKYISKEMAMMTALTTENMLLHENYDAMLYWNAPCSYYCIIVEYVTDNPIEKYSNYECTYWREDTHEDAGYKNISLYFKY